MFCMNIRESSIIFLILFSLTIILSSMAHATGRRARVLFVENDIHNKDRWIDINPDEKESLKELIKLLMKSSKGKQVLLKAKQKAEKHGKTLLDVIHSAKVSTADTTLIRRFFADNPYDVVYELRSRIYLSRNLPVIDGVLDLAHELTHYISRTPFNPYQQNFNLLDFIKSTIEGRGGEADAYMTECIILKELFPQEEHHNSNCSLLIDAKTGKHSKKLAIKKFYQVGGDLSDFLYRIKQFKISMKDLPFLSDEEPLYISSAYGLPYPIAALEEYLSIMKRVCINDRKRLEIMKKNLLRLPASQQKSSRSSNYQKVNAIYKKRCLHF